MLHDVIAAISTPPGKGGVAVIRMSGEGSVKIADATFRSVSGKALASYPARVQVYGHIIYNEEKIDDCLVTRFESGSSFTGEETVEISTHGGVLITRTVMEALLLQGARVAEPGEFTMRAHLSGRLSLTEAEAIGTLLEARSYQQIRLSASPARAALAERIDKIRSSILDTLSSVFARIDYPDEDLGELTGEDVKERLAAIRQDLSSLISSYTTGRAINEGVSTVICGKPNVGKSTLYNLILGEDAAIVTDIPGTTRDLLSSTVPLGKVLVRLSDTAGIHSDSHDTVERIGIERSVKSIKEAELILALFDATRPLDAYDEEIIREVKEAAGFKACILTKSLANEAQVFEAPSDIFDLVLKISVKEAPDEAISILRERVEEIFLDERIKVGEDAIVSSARQHASLCRGLDFIDRAIEAYENGVPEDAAASEIERALGAISEVDGRQVGEDVVRDIFSKFCVGK